jgi:hypothetical protein
MKNAVFWDVVPCRYCGCSHLLMLVPRSRIFSSTMKMEAIRSSETSVYKITTRRYIPEDCILQEMGILKNP